MNCKSYPSMHWVGDKVHPLSHSDDTVARLTHGDKLFSSSSQVTVHYVKRSCWTRYFKKKLKYDKQFDILIWYQSWADIIKDADGENIFIVTFIIS